MTMVTKIPETRKATTKRAKDSSALETGQTAKRRPRNNSEMAAAHQTKSALLIQQQLDAVRREHAILQQAIYEAAQIQRKLCSPRELVWGEFEIAGEIFPVRHLSGDFFKVMPLDAVLGLAVGDIAGKGLSAGIWQAHLIDLIQRCARAYLHPADVIAGVNRELCLDRGEPPITALFFARLDPLRNELQYCNAGLPAPLIMRRGTSVDRLEEGGPMLGALQEASYSCGTVYLNPGDMLIAYSDGLTECRNHEDQEFEIGRLSSAVKAVDGTTANQVLFSTLATVLDFAEQCPPSDDLTLLVVRRCETKLMEIISERNNKRDKDFSVSRRLSSAAVGQAC
jgi:sigma-B regulation protein RsbU (phosphoserine phosphatase)